MKRERHSVRSPDDEIKMEGVLDNSVDCAEFLRLESYGWEHFSNRYTLSSFNHMHIMTHYLGFQNDILCYHIVVDNRTTENSRFELIMFKTHNYWKLLYTTLSLLLSRRQLELLFLYSLWSLLFSYFLSILKEIYRTILSHAVWNCRCGIVG